MDQCADGQELDRQLRRLRRKPLSRAGQAGEELHHADPQFVDDKNLDYHLQPESPCLRAAAAGGNLGFSYTPDLVALMKEAQRLRDQGVIKF